MAIVCDPCRMEQVPLYVLVGPSGVGKGTVLGRLRDAHPEVVLSVSATTRDPRTGEVDGEHYFFVDDAEFDRLIACDQLLEWAVVHGKHRYGTPISWVEEQQKLGRTAVLEVDVEGARQVAKRMPEAKIIFLAPPSWDELESRLRGRGTESEAELQARLRTAKAELASAGEFDQILVNAEVNSTALELARLMQLN